MSVLLIVSLLNFQTSSPARAESVATPEPLAGQTASCVDDRRIYKICTDQKVLFNEKLSEAKARNVPLVIVFGTDWCSRCRELSRVLPTKIKDKLVMSKVAILDGHKIVASGEHLLNETLKSAKLNRRHLSAGTPYVFVLDPKTKRIRLIPSKQVFEMLDLSQSTEEQWLNLLRPTS